MEVSGVMIQRTAVFRAHRDILSNNKNDPRKFALSLNLNDEFTVGGLRFPKYGERLY